MAYLQRAEHDGIIIEVIPNDASGALDLAALEAMLASPTALISITWIPTNPAAGVGKLAHKYGVPYLLDACQAVGQMPVDATALGCDYLTATGRKFLRGPRGTGFLYIREAMIAKTEPAVIDHFAAPWVAENRYELRRFENWENAYALRAGLGAAVRYTLDFGIEAIHTHAWALADRLREGLHHIKGITLHDAGDTHCAIVSFSMAAATPCDVFAYLHTNSIAIGASDTNGTLLDSRARSLPTLLRAAPHYYNSETEIDDLLRLLKTYLQTAT